MSVGSDASIDTPEENGEAPVVEYEVPIIPADQARDELGPLIDAVRWNTSRMAEVEALLKGYLDDDRDAPTAGSA